MSHHPLPRTHAFPIPPAGFSTNQIVVNRQKRRVGSLPAPRNGKDLYVTPSPFPRLRSVPFLSLPIAQFAFLPSALRLPSVSQLDRNRSISALCSVFSRLGEFRGGFCPVFRGRARAPFRTRTHGRGWFKGYFHHSPFFFLLQS
jgi:hypothetical protein